MQRRIRQGNLLWRWRDPCRNQHTYFSRHWSCTSRLGRKFDFDYDIERIRNFSVIAHIDHGKSTLSSRLLELTDTIPAVQKSSQILDKLQVERERGITVKAQTCSMLYEHNNRQYLLNLIDTPGHVDFRNEVTSSLAASEGALLLIDASQGIQAQTVANFFLAFSQDVKIVPVLNKIDLPTADSAAVLESLELTFDIPGKDALLVSAKSNINIEKILPAICEGIPPPDTEVSAPFKSLLIDSWYDKYLGVIALVRVFDGAISPGSSVVSCHSGKMYVVSEVGVMFPDRVQTPTLKAGQVGYLVTGMKDASEALVGDTYHTAGHAVEPLPGFSETSPMVFAGVFPVDPADFQKLDEDICRLALNDRSLCVTKESSGALGNGWRIGFLGSLHLSVFEDRLRNEHNGEIILTQPTVPYRITDLGSGEVRLVSNPSEFPDSRKQLGRAFSFEEPIVEATMILPSQYLGPTITLAEEARGTAVETQYLTSDRVLLKYVLPLSSLLEDFFGKLKSISHGFASLDYEDAGYEVSDLVKVTLLVNGVTVDALSVIVHRSKAILLSKSYVRRLKPLLTRALFDIVIQASCEGRFLARETIKSARKDVLAKCYGGDSSRKMKLLKKQREGKKRMRSFGNVQIDSTAFHDFLQR
ncbi:Translation factor guf1 mitochondrial [Savitreella phatthalungensis]